MAPHKKTPEGYVKSAVMEFLAVKHVFCLRTNSGTQVIYDARTGKKRAIHLAEKGTADLLALVPLGSRCGFLPLWIETKAPGGKLTAEQMNFQLERLADGHEYLVAYAIDDVEAWFKQQGL